MNKTISKTGFVAMTILMTLLLTPIVNAQVTLDGVVNEPSWTTWFTDNDSPSYITYTSYDSQNIYIGIVTSIEDIGISQLQIAFKGAEHDWIIKLSDITETKYKVSKMVPDGEYWGNSKNGLPEGVQIVQSLTEGYVSYEISIPKELLGKYGEDFPNNFNLWLMYTVENNGGWVMSSTDNPNNDVNFYPPSRADWWFDYSIETMIENDDVPSFHAPEFPIGTIVSLFVMLSATILISKKKSF